MSTSHASFKRALGQFASGVTVVTTRDAKGHPLGLTVSSFCSVSLDPPLVLVSIDRRSEAHPGLRHSRLFGVSVLAEGQEEISRRFSRGGAEKFRSFEAQTGAHGLLLVPGALAQMECRVVAEHAAGDHVLYLGEVLGLRSSPGRPLVYHASGYHRLGAREHPL